MTQAAEDSAQLLPAVDRLEQRLKKKRQRMVADGSYTTRENIERTAGREIDFVGSMGREETPSGATAPNRLPPSAFLYQSETNRYLCPEGKLLRPQGRFNSANKRGFVAYRYEAKIGDCAPRIRKPECCPENQSGGRGLLQRVENTAFQAFREKMASQAAQAQYRRRSQVAEFCYAWIKNKLGLRQFHVRGLVKVQMQMLWACFTCNLRHWIRLNKLRATAAVT